MCGDFRHKHLFLWGFKVLCYVHRWLLQEFGILEVKIGGILEVQGVKNYCGESEGAKDEVFEVRQWRQVYLRRVQSLLGRWRHRMLAKYSRAIKIEWSSRMHDQTLTERARSIRLHDDMSEGSWVEAVSHACYLVNISPSITVNLQILEEIWWGEFVDYSTLRIFGCLMYSLVDSQKRNKLESKY